MRSPSNAMLRSPARAGHGSTMCVILLAATALPAPKLTLSRRSWYMSVVHAPSSIVAASASRAAPLFRDMTLSLGDVEDVADLRRRAVGAALDPALHRHGDFRLAEPEEFEVVRRPRGVERRAQHVSRARRAHDARRHDDDE